MATRFLNSEQLKELLHKGVAWEVPNGLDVLEFRSHVIVADRKDGDRRPIFDLRALNKHVSVPNFK